MRDKRSKIFDYIAKDYDHHMKVTGHIEAEISLLKESIEPFEASVSRVLDIACGTGLSSSILGRILNGVRIVGIDISKNMLDIARSKFGGVHNVSFISMNVEDMNRQVFTEKFDLIVVVYGVCWFDIGAVVPTLREMLKAGGRVVIVDDLDLDEPLFAKRFPELAKDIAYVRTVKNRSQVESMFSANGFNKTGEKEYELKGYHTSYALTFRKIESGNLK